MSRIGLAIFSVLLATGCGQDSTSAPAPASAQAATTTAPPAPAAVKPAATEPAATEPAATEAAGAGAGDATAAADQASSAPTDAASPDKKLLFFLNPNGRPCQMQDQILKQMGTDLTDKVTLAYVATTDPNAREVMTHFGIRALPTLIIVDADGKELHRFPAGIRDADTILGALN